ncbi:MAG TPA: glycosyltransferase family 2 protein [Xanthobacteraceae bacterium]|nr:glycosyltransferase family 2 protein [Xanthobacteraceae bacterium]
MISFIVPALNEELGIAPTVRTITAAAENCAVSDYEIILIDDGSTDGTYAAMSSAAKADSRVVVLRNERNLGLGTSIRRGIAAVRYSQFMVVPGDNDMSQALVELLLTFRNEAEILLTVPLNKETRTLGRNIISMIYQLIQMVAFSVYVAYINGPGIWPTAKVRAVGLAAKRFSIISEMNVKLLRSGCSYAELPGYFNALPKARRTVTLKNLSEVIRLFVTLAYKIHIAQRKQFLLRPHRIQIDFSTAARERLLSAQKYKPLRVVSGA